MNFRYKNEELLSGKKYENCMVGGRGGTKIQFNFNKYYTV